MTPVPLRERLAGECLPRPGRLETQHWRLRWDESCVVVGQVDSLEEPWRVAGEGLDALVLQLSRSMMLVRPRGVARLLGGGAEPQPVARLHVELRGASLPQRVRLVATVDDTALLDGLDVLDPGGCDEAPLESLLALCETLSSLGATLARTASSGAPSPQHDAGDPHPVTASRLRRERDALRETTASLEQELAAARARIAELEAAHTKLPSLERQVAGLEYQLREAQAALSRLHAERTEFLGQRPAAPTATAHNLAERPAATTSPGTATAPAVCPTCRAERGASIPLVLAPVHTAGMTLCACPRCGWAGFVRDS